MITFPRSGACDPQPGNRPCHGQRILERRALWKNLSAAERTGRIPLGFTSFVAATLYGVSEEESVATSSSKLETKRRTLPDLQLPIDRGTLVAIIGTQWPALN